MPGHGDRGVCIVFLWGGSCWHPILQKRKRGLRRHIAAMRETSWSVVAHRSPAEASRSLFESEAALSYVASSRSAMQ